MERERKEFLRQDCSVSEDDSSSSEDDDNAELLTEELEDGFFKVLSQLKKKDSKLYEESVKYFPTNSSEVDTLSDLNTVKSEKKSQKDYREWLKGQREKVENKEVKEDLEALHDFWTSPTLNKDEQFLRDYILNKKFLEPDDSFNIEEEISKLSDEEREVQEQLLFEHKYNCRFENPDQQLEENLKPKTKRKKNKASIEDPVHGNNVCLHQGNPPNRLSEKVESNAQGSKIETKKKKRKRKRNKYSKNKISEEKVEENKALWTNINNRIPEETDENIKDHTIGLGKNIAKNGVCYSHQNNYISGAEKNNFQTKKNTHFQNLIVKENKNKKLKFGKMLTKKQKAANALGKT